MFKCSEEDFPPKNYVKLKGRKSVLGPKPKGKGPEMNAWMARLRSLKGKNKGKKKTSKSPRGMQDANKREEEVSEAMQFLRYNENQRQVLREIVDYIHDNYGGWGERAQDTWRKLLNARRKGITPGEFLQILEDGDDNPRYNELRIPRKN